MSLDFDPVETIFQSSKKPESAGTRYSGLDTSSVFLSEGHCRTPECRPLPIPLIWDRDVPLRMRDGVYIRVDIFRPQDSMAKLPAIMAWSPYGKTGAGQLYY